MKAIQYDKYGGADVLKYVDLPIPQPKDNEVLIKINYAGLNPVDWKIREGFLQKAIATQLPVIPGWDASGIIQQVGKDVKHLKVGDEVFTYTRKDFLQEGTYAEYITCDASVVAKKPKNTPFKEAASIPLVALTCWQALFDIAKLKKGDVVLIQAGAGGVGSFAIQFAKWKGATVITTTSKKNTDYVKNLGADVVVNYDQENFYERIKKEFPQGIDVVFEMIGGKSMLDAARLLKKGGVIVSIVEPFNKEEAQRLGVRSEHCFVRPNGDQLREIARLVEENRIHIPFIEEMPLREAALAQEKNKEGHTRGKIVLKVP